VNWKTLKIMLNEMARLITVCSWAVVFLLHELIGRTIYFVEYPDKGSLRW